MPLLLIWAFTVHSARWTRASDQRINCSRSWMTCTLPPSTQDARRLQHLGRVDVDSSRDPAPFGQNSGVES